MSEQLRLLILEETSKFFPTFKTTGISLLIKFRSQGEEENPTVYLKECITALTNNIVDDVPDRGLMGLRTRNCENE